MEDHRSLRSPCRRQQGQQHPRSLSSVFQALQSHPEPHQLHHHPNHRRLLPLRRFLILRARLSGEFDLSCPSHDTTARWRPSTRPPKKPGSLRRSSFNLCVFVLLMHSQSGQRQARRPWQHPQAHGQEEEHGHSGLPSHPYRSYCVDQVQLGLAGLQEEGRPGGRTRAAQEERVRELVELHLTPQIH